VSRTAVTPARSRSPERWTRCPPSSWDTTTAAGASPGGSATGGVAGAGTAIYSEGFRPFQSPVPFIFVRHGVLSDWKFFLDQEDLFGHWARRFGESAVHALGEELRRLPWNARRD
jgi:hypothetical protein